jgi:hypothetical protein
MGMKWLSDYRSHSRRFQIQFNVTFNLFPEYPTISYFTSRSMHYNEYICFCTNSQSNIYSKVQNRPFIGLGSNTGILEVNHNKMCDVRNYTWNYFHWLKSWESNFDNLWRRDGRTSTLSPSPTSIPLPSTRQTFAKHLLFILFVTFNHSHIDILSHFMRLTVIHCVDGQFTRSTLKVEQWSHKILKRI